MLYNGDGFELLIKSSGSKIWQFRYNRPVTKKRAKKSIGPYPPVRLADARNYRTESRSLLVKHIDPRDHQQELLHSSLEAKTNTFQLVAERWWNVKSERDRELCQRYLALSLKRCLSCGWRH